MIRNIVFGGPSTVMAPKRCLEAVGLFDQTLRSREDWELWIRLVRRFPMRSVNTVLSCYRWHSNNKHRRLEYAAPSRLAVLQAHRPSMRWAVARKAWSHLYGDLAEDYLDMGKRGLAGWYAVQAIVSYPGKVWAKDRKYRVAAKAALPGWALDGARRLRRLAARAGCAR